MTGSGPAMGPTYPLLAEVKPAVPGSGDKPALGAVYRPVLSKDNFPPTLPGITTLLELFEQSCKKYPDCNCLGSRPIVNGEAQPFKYLTYKEVEDAVVAVASGYSQLGVQPKDKVAVLSANCEEWMIAMQGMNRMNVTCVPLYETLGEHALEFIIKHSEAKLVLVNSKKLPALLKALPLVKDTLSYGVVYWGDAPQDQVKAITDLGLKATSWSQLVALGQDHEAFPSRPAPEDLCTIMYTSGTTGDPKGVMMSHNSIIATIAGVKAFLQENNEAMGTGDSYLSYLPLAHIMDRVIEELMLHVGGSIGYFQGDIKKLVDDIDALKPTLFAGVPRVYERICSGVQDQVKKAGFLRHLIFDWAYKRKLYWMENGYKHDVASRISDIIVFEKIKKRLGGRVRVILSGGAPLSPSIEEFLRVAMCAPVVQGYGLTESCAASFIAAPHKHSHSGTVGAPMPHTEVRLEEVKELGYSPENDPQRGELCMRGPALFSGYYKNEEMTKEAVDADGFFHTGDIAEFTPEGAIRIIDRKKNIFKLSHGEYVAVEKIENAYKSCPDIEQVWVYGDSKQSVLVAVVVPKERNLMDWASQQGIQGDFKAVCESKAAKEFLLKQMTGVGKAAGLNGIEVVKALHLETEQWTVENELMTPSFKLKRAPLQKHYQKEIDAMYSTLNAAAANGGK